MLAALVLSRRKMTGWYFTYELPPFPCWFT
jgi:hypothetical protein